MKPNRFPIPAFAVILCVAVAGTLLVPSASAAFRYLQEGMTAPVVSGKDLITGAEINSEQRPEGRITIVTFWASWSQRSLEMLADLKSLKEQYSAEGFRIIAVNVDNQAVSSATREMIKQTVTTLALPFPVIIDDGLKSYYEFGVIAVPSTAILDSSGILRYAPSGYSYIIRDRIVDSIEVLLGRQKPTEAIALRRSYEPRPKAARYYHLAVQLANQRMYERALANLEPAMAADSNFSAPHNLRGQVLLELDSLGAAAAEFEAAVRLDSGSVAAWAGWGRALRQSGHPEQAYEKLAAALERDGSYTPALLDLALCLADRQATGEAIDSLLAARELNPQNPRVHYYLGRVYRLSDQLAEAVGSYRAALELLFPGP